jgi:hypothetical protein
MEGDVNFTTGVKEVRLNIFEDFLASQKKFSDFFYQQFSDPDVSGTDPQIWIHNTAKKLPVNIYGNGDTLYIINTHAVRR